jgi:hypothetical protein
MTNTMRRATVVALSGCFAVLAAASWGDGEGSGVFERQRNVCAPCRSDFDCDGGDPSLRVKCVELSRAVGRCACADRTTLCEFGVCTNLDSDLDNCGACGNACDFDAGELCNRGTCEAPPAACNPIDVADVGAASCQDLTVADGLCDQYRTSAGGLFNCADNPSFPGTEPNPCIENGACLLAPLRDGCFLAYEKALGPNATPIPGYATNCDNHCTNNLDCDPWCNNYARLNGRRKSPSDVSICSCDKVCF